MSSMPATDRVERTAANESARRPACTETTACASAILRSCLYECNVMHHRLEPKRHHFEYRIFMFALDLDEIDTVASRVIVSRGSASLYYSGRIQD